MLRQPMNEWKFAGLCECKQNRFYYTPASISLSRHKIEWSFDVALSAFRLLMSL